MNTNEAVTTRCRRLRTVGDDVYKSAPEAGTLALFALKELDDREHCGILIETVNKLVSQQTERPCTYEMCLRAPNELSPRANDDYG
jgi:hypothetical protein